MVAKEQTVDCRQFDSVKYDLLLAVSDSPVLAPEIKTVLGEFLRYCSDEFSEKRKLMHVLAMATSGGKLEIEGDAYARYGEEVIVPREGKPFPLVLRETEDGISLSLVREPEYNGECSK